MTPKRVTKKVGNALETVGQTVGQGVVTLVHHGHRGIKSMKRPVKQMYKSCEGATKKAVSFARKEPVTSVLIGVGTGMLMGYLVAREK
ncbi:MAG: hypothetical protein AUH96_05665 [Nitrospirae bacterium 13_2_20CM_2_61_4]|nr:MAG: hypothetical protein AUH96_05665 [Nitrospirae bacterium 13_2_20CM_2_61_4]